MKTAMSLLALVLTAVLACACNKAPQSAPAASGDAAPQTAPAPAAAPAMSPATGAQPASAADADAIRKAIEAHLAENKGINMAAMDMALTNVQVQGDKAQANAEFRVKQGGGTMQMTYRLERHAGGWLVLQNTPAGGQFQHPPMDATHSGAAASPTTPSMPNVGNYLKDHPAPNKQ